MSRRIVTETNSTNKNLSGCFIIHDELVTQPHESSL